MFSKHESFFDWINRFIFDHGFIRAIYSNTWRVDEMMFRSAQPSPFMLENLKKKGIKTIINLRGERDNSINFVEKNICEKINLNLIEFKLLSRAAPSKEQIHNAKKIFETISYPALMHCKSGADRTGIMSVLYLIFHKHKDVKEALSELSFKYLHIKISKSGILDAFFEKYLLYSKQGGKSDFYDWSQNIYDQNDLQKSFKFNLVRSIIDKLFNRE